MSMRILCRNIIRSAKPCILHQKPFYRFESVLPALESLVEPKSKIDLQLLYREYPNAERFLEICKQCNLCERTLAKVIKETPEVTSYEPNTIMRNIEQFFQLGYEPHKIAALIQSYPRILNYETDRIMNTFEAWRSCSLNEKFLRELFVECSWLFSVDINEVKIRLPRIHYLMGHKINRVFSLLRNSPSIMLEDWDAIEQKFEYIMKTMRYLEKEISKSTALAQPMSRIKIRHIFLYRVGVYVRPKLKETTGINPHKNPPLAQITDPDDDNFAQHTAKVSPEEFAVFKKLMRYEEKDQKEDDLEPEKYQRYSEFDIVD